MRSPSYVRRFEIHSGPSDLRSTTEIRSKLSKPSFDLLSHLNRILTHLKSCILPLSCFWCSSDSLFDPSTIASCPLIRVTGQSFPRSFVLFISFLSFIWFTYVDDCFCSQVSPLFDGFNSSVSPFVYLIQVAGQSFLLFLLFGLLMFVVLNLHAVVEIASLICFCLFLSLLHFDREWIEILRK